MKNAIIQAIEKKQTKTDIPAYRAGDTIKVSLKIHEGEGKKDRIQVFEGTVLRKQGGGMNETVTVRKIVDGVGVEKTLPIHSQSVAKIEVVKFGKARRGKLYYLRDLVGSKVTRMKEDLHKNIAAATEKAKVKKEAEHKKRTEVAATKQAAADAKAAAPKVEAPKAEAPKADVPKA